MGLGRVQPRSGQQEIEVLCSVLLERPKHNRMIGWCLSYTVINSYPVRIRSEPCGSRLVRKLYLGQEIATSVSVLLKKQKYFNEKCLAQVVPITHDGIKHRLDSN